MTDAEEIIRNMSADLARILREFMSGKSEESFCPSGDVLVIVAGMENRQFDDFDIYNLRLESKEIHDLLSVNYKIIYCDDTRQKDSRNSDIGTRLVRNREFSDILVVAESDYDRWHVADTYSFVLASLANGAFGKTPTVTKTNHDYVPF